MGNAPQGHQAEVFRNLTYPLGNGWAPDAGEIHEVAQGVFWFHMPLPFSLARINLWLLEDGDGWTVVDTGLDSPESRQCWEQALDRHLGGRPIRRVIVTHMHPDHIGLAGWLTQRFDCDLWMSRDEFLMCRALASDTGREAPQVAIRFYHASGLDDKALDVYRSRFGEFGTLIHQLPDSFYRLVDNQTLEINGRYWQVVTGSGHSPEHVSLYCPALKLVITGDQILPRITSNVSVFPTEPYGDPLTEWLQSCNKLRRELPDNLLVLPAHEEPFYGLHIRAAQLISFHERTLSRLHAFLETPKKATDCFPVLFSRAIKPGILELAIGETLASLNCLMNRRMVECVRGADGVDLYQQLPDASYIDWNG